MIRQIKRDSLSALVVSERDIAGIFAPPGTDGIENLVFHQLEIACLAAKQRKKFIVKPERVDQHVIHLSELGFRGMQIVLTTDHSGLAGADVVDKLCL